MSDDADAERALRIEQMTINIEKMRFDMAEQQRQAAVQQKWETRKFVVSTVIAAAAAVGSGIAIGSYFTRHSPAPANQQPMFPPGTVITIPAAPQAPVQPK